MKLSELYLNRYLYRDNTQDSATKDSVFESNDSSDPVSPGIASGGAAQDINQGNVMIDPGNLPDSTVNVGDWGWTQTCVFSSTDTNTVSWGAGTFTDATGNSYSIDAGNTGNMVAKTYIYLSLLDSETVYQISTTPTDAVGVGKVLIAVAENETDSATFNLTEATQIVGDNILANTINAGKLNVGTLSAITANMGTLTSGSISVVNGGNTIGFTPSGTNAIFSGPTGAPTFKVTPAGVLTVTGAFFSGAVTITSGSGISNLTDAGDLAVRDSVGTGQIDTTVISGGKIITGLLTASNIQTGTLDASLATITNINASNINTGTLSAITVQTSTGNERIKLVSDNLEFYSGGSLMATVDGTTRGAGGVRSTGDWFTANNKSYWIASSGGGATEYGGISVTSGNEFWLTLGTNNSFFIKNNAQSANYFTVSSTRAYINGYLYLDTKTSNPTTLTGAVWHFSNAADQFRGVPTGSTVYSFDMTVV